MIPEPQALDGVRRGRVLIVDDDHDFADSLGNFLALEGYRVAVAYNAD